MSVVSWVNHTTHHPPYLWDFLWHFSAAVMSFGTADWEERETEILAVLPGRLQMPLPQQWEFSGSHPRGMHFQMAQLAGFSDLSPRGLNRCQALLRTRYSAVFNKAISRKCPHCDGRFVHEMKMRIIIQKFERFCLILFFIDAPKLTFWAETESSGYSWPKTKIKK